MFAFIFYVCIFNLKLYFFSCTLNAPRVGIFIISISENSVWCALTYCSQYQLWLNVIPRSFFWCG